MTDLEAPLGCYLAALEGGRRLEAIDVALGMLQRGVSAEQVITDLLVPAQAEIGRGWQEGRTSVAMEHLASAITSSALQAVANTEMSAPAAVREGSRGRVVIACSEGEWHVLPGQMAAEILRLRGADVSFIGPSVPARELSDFLGDDPPTAVAVTCSMPMSLVGAWRSISALRAIGMTIVYGGRGFGPDGRWGLALGADQWAPDFASGADTLLAAVDQPSPAPREAAGKPERIAEVRVLALDHEALVQEAARTAFDRWPAIRLSDAAVRATREDLAATLRVVAAATLVDDPVLVTDYVDWFEVLLSSRGLPVAFVASAFDLLLGVLPEELVRAREMAGSGMAACAGPALGAGYAL
jgi:methanogenic corrinoid protein MtbC1